MVPVPDASPPVARRVSAYVAVLVLVISFLVLAPPSAHSQADTTTKAAAASGAAAADSAASALPRIVITTEKYGDIVIELYPKEAPKAVERILSLVRAGFYNGLPFHRVESYVVQTGSAESELPPIEGEMFSVKLKHEDGMVGMARVESFPLEST